MWNAPVVDLSSRAVRDALLVDLPPSAVRNALLVNLPSIAILSDRAIPCSWLHPTASEIGCCSVGEPHPSATQPPPPSTSTAPSC